MDPSFVDNFVMTSMFDHDYSPFQKSGSKAKHDELEALSTEGQASYPEQKGDSSGENRRRLTAEEDQQQEDIHQHKMDAVKNHMAAMHEKTIERAVRGKSNENPEDNGANDQPVAHGHVLEANKHDSPEASHSLHIATPDELIHETEVHEKELEEKEKAEKNEISVKPDTHPFRHPGHDEDDKIDDGDDNNNGATHPPTEWLDDDYTMDPDHQYAGRHHYGMHGDDMSYMGKYRVLPYL
jgi:hypothetical protein